MRFASGHRRGPSSLGQGDIRGMGLHHHRRALPIDGPRGCDAYGAGGGDGDGAARDEMADRAVVGIVRGWQIRGVLMRKPRMFFMRRDGARCVDVPGMGHVGQAREIHSRHEQTGQHSRVAR